MEDHNEHPIAKSAGQATRRLIQRWQEFSKNLDMSGRIAVIAGTIAAIWAVADAFKNALNSYFPLYDCEDKFAVTVSYKGSRITCDFNYIGDTVEASINKTLTFIISLGMNFLIAAAIVGTILAFRWIVAGRR